MGKNLFNAAVAGDVGTLRKLLEQDPLILDKATLNCEDKNPLHIAAMLGNVDFVRAIKELNFSSCYRMCLARDRDGRNPLHLAAVYGESQVLQVLIEADAKFRDAALEKADGGGTILHLRVKYNQLAVFKELVEKFRSPELVNAKNPEFVNAKNLEFVNAKNEDGMTILHLAIYHNRDFETFILHLIEVTGSGLTDITNANGNTALDLLVSRGYPAYCFPEYLFKASDIMGTRKSRRQWVEKSKDALMVVASLIATMAFQAVISPPGVVWQDELLEGPNPHRVGQAVMAQSRPKYYRFLNGANAVAFTGSLSTIILLISKPGHLNRFFMPALVIAVWVAIAAITTSYALSTVMVVTNDARSPVLAHVSHKNGIVGIVLVVWWDLVYIKICETCLGRLLSKILERSSQTRQKMFEVERPVFSVFWKITTYWITA